MQQKFTHVEQSVVNRFKLVWYLDSTSIYIFAICNYSNSQLFGHVCVHVYLIFISIKHLAGQVRIWGLSRVTYLSTATTHSLCKKSLYEIFNRQLTIRRRQSGQMKNQCEGLSSVLDFDILDTHPKPTLF